MHGAGVAAQFAPDRVLMRTPAGVFVIRFPGADPGVLLEGIRPLPGRIHILRAGGTAASSFAIFGGVWYRGLYPGIDLEYALQGEKLEFRFLVAAGADPGRIRMKYDGMCSRTMTDSAHSANARR